MQQRLYVALKAESAMYLSSPPKWHQVEHTPRRRRDTKQAHCCCVGKNDTNTFRNSTQRWYSLGPTDTHTHTHTHTHLAFAADLARELDSFHSGVGCAGLRMCVPMGFHSLHLPGCTEPFRILQRPVDASRSTNDPTIRQRPNVKISTENRKPQNYFPSCARHRAMPGHERVKKIRPAREEWLANP